MSDLPNIAFIGKAGSGKDTAAELLIETLDYRRIAFADKLKDVAAELWGASARTDRDKLQKLGEYVRNIDPDTWVNAALANDRIQRKHGALRYYPLIVPDGATPGKTWVPIVVTDCRYKNEAWTLKGEGFTIIRIVADRTERINRLRSNGKLGPSGWEEHVSETDLDDWPEDYKVYNLESKATLLKDLTDVLNLERQAAAT